MDRTILDRCSRYFALDPNQLLPGAGHFSRVARAIIGKHCGFLEPIVPEAVGEA